MWEKVYENTNVKGELAKARGELKRTNKRVRIAPASKPEREVLKDVAEYLAPMNQGLETIGSATNFRQYVEKTYMQTKFRKLASSTQDRTKGRHRETT